MWPPLQAERLVGPWLQAERLVGPLLQAERLVVQARLEELEQHLTIKVSSQVLNISACFHNEVGRTLYYLRMA